MPHVELLQIGQQTEVGRKRRELVLADLKQRGFWSDHDRIASTSHIELIKLHQVRNFAWQRAKVVGVERESLHARHAEHVGRHLRQTNAIKLTMKTKTMCES